MAPKILAAVGVALELGAALFLLVWFDPRRPRYEIVTGWRGQNPGLENLLRDQRWVAAAIATGGALQLLAVFLKA